MDQHQPGQFEQIPMPISLFPKLPFYVVDDLSTDQYCAYRLRWAIINGSVSDDLLYLEVGPIVYSRWPISGCRTLRYYVTLDEPSPTLKILARFCLNGVFLK